jgi:hypothetical protein
VQQSPQWAFRTKCLRVRSGEMELARTGLYPDANSPGSGGDITRCIARPSGFRPLDSLIAFAENLLRRVTRT